MNYRKLLGFQREQKDHFCGISRSFYYKWKGWERLKEGAGKEEMLRLAEEFYETYYYYPLRLDLVKDKSLAFVILQFAVINGKKKTRDKLQLFVRSVEEVNEFSKTETLRFIMELLEFHDYTNNYDIRYLLDYYRSIY